MENLYQHRKAYEQANNEQLKYKEQAEKKAQIVGKSTEGI